MECKGVYSFGEVEKRITGGYMQLVLKGDLCIPVGYELPQTAYYTLLSFEKLRVKLTYRPR